MGSEVKAKRYTGSPPTSVQEIPLFMERARHIKPPGVILSLVEVMLLHGAVKEIDWHAVV